MTLDGQIAMLGSEDKILRVWNLVSGKCRHTLEGHTAMVWSLSVTADGWTVVSAGEPTPHRG